MKSRALFTSDNYCTLNSKKRQLMFSIFRMIKSDEMEVDDNDIYHMEVDNENIENCDNMAMDID